MGFGGYVHHVVELEVDAHELKFGAILSFIVPKWVRFVRNNIYIQNDKSKILSLNVVKDMICVVFFLHHEKNIC